MGYYMGIDLGGTNIKAGVVDDAFRIIGRAKAKTGIPRPAEEVMDAMAECAKAAAADAGVPWEQIRQVGIGVPGTANEETGVVEYANNLLFENVPMREYLQKRLHKEIDITNDANAAALGEVLAGAARGASNAVAVTLGTGVGGGIIIDGRLFTGFHYGNRTGRKKVHLRPPGLFGGLRFRHWADPQHERGDGGLSGFPDVGAGP